MKLKQREELTVIAKAITSRQPMNKTEERYAWLLDGYRQAGEILRYEFERITLKLGEDCRYTPDFFVVAKDSTIEFHEVKGTFVRDDARVKLKAAASMFPFKFVLATWKKDRWDLEEIGR